MSDAAVEVQNAVTSEEIEAAADAERDKPLATYTMEDEEEKPGTESESEKVGESKKDAKEETEG